MNAHPEHLSEALERVRRSAHDAWQPDQPAAAGYIVFIEPSGYQERADGHQDAERARAVGDGYSPVPCLREAPGLSCSAVGFVVSLLDAAWHFGLTFSLGAVAPAAGVFHKQVFRHLAHVRRIGG